MRTTMDKAGRIVVPLELRKRIGLVPGPIDIDTNGVGLVIEQVITTDDLVEKDGRLLLPSRGGPGLTEEQVRELRLADQR